MKIQDTVISVSGALFYVRLSLSLSMGNTHVNQIKAFKVQNIKRLNQGPANNFLIKYAVYYRTFIYIFLICSILPLYVVNFLYLLLYIVNFLYCYG